MLSEITTAEINVIDLFWTTLQGMLPWVRHITRDALLTAVILPLGGYVMGACACRVRYGTGKDISHSWAALYLSVAACAALLMLAAIYGQARTVDVLLALTVAAYIHFTTPAWRSGVPPVARPDLSDLTQKEHS